jgi:glycosyltransferase involved in cell wall biosynthesis
VTGLRIAHVVCADAFAGVERYIATVSPALASLGHKLTVVGGDPQRMKEFLGDEVRYLPGSNPLLVATQLARAGRQDIVHAHMTEAETVGAIISPIIGSHLVATQHFAKTRGGPKLLRRIVERRIHTEIAISAYVAEHCGRPARVVLNAVTSSPQVDPSAKVAVVLQRLEPEKNTDRVIRAWAIAALYAHGWKLVVAGDGSQRNALEKLAVDLGVAESVQFVGLVSDVNQMRSRSGFQVAPCEIEGFGLSAAEAMAAGLPVLAANGGAHRELLFDVPELLYDIAGNEPLARAMQRLAASVESRRSLGRRVREVQQRKFSIEAHLAALDALYREVVAA